MSGVGTGPASDPPAHRWQAGPTMHVVLVEPQIAPNTGNIGRTCVALGAALHLVHPLGFDLSLKSVRRAGLDYWPRLMLTEHANAQAFVAGVEAADPALERVWLLSGKAGRCVFDAPLTVGDSLVFGCETRGLPDWLLERWAGRVLRLPMVAGERGLNVATAVCAVGYELVRRGLVTGRLRLGKAGDLQPGERRERELRQPSARMEASERVLLPSSVEPSADQRAV